MIVLIVSELSVSNHNFRHVSQDYHKHLYFHGLTFII